MSVFLLNGFLETLLTILNLWISRNRIGLSQVGKMYIVAAVLRNASTCLYGNETSQFFELDPPTLQEYFS